MFRGRTLANLALVGGLLAASFAPGVAAAQVVSGSLAQQLTAAAASIDDAVVAAQGGDLATARLDFNDYDEAWDVFEDDFRAVNPDAYKRIEAGSDAVKDALDSADPAAALTALQSFKQVLAQQVAALG
jgi:hypothetical protein